MPTVIDTSDSTCTTAAHINEWFQKKEKAEYPGFLRELRFRMRPDDRTGLVRFLSQPHFVPEFRRLRRDPKS